MTNNDHVLSSVTCKRQQAIHVLSRVHKLSQSQVKYNLIAKHTSCNSLYFEGVMAFHCAVSSLESFEKIEKIGLNGFGITYWSLGGNC